MPKLALFGGMPLRTEPFPDYNVIGDEEKEAVIKVIESGNLSQFLGSWHPDFYGGPNVQEFEKTWAKYFEIKYAISLNSATSALFAAIGALGIQPGDEVIVSPYTMTASSICPMIWGGVPVFADINEDTFCLDPKSIEEKITDRTKAIVVVHILGHPADMGPIMDLAKRHGLYVIEDCAQAPLAEYKSRRVGTIGDMGIFSLNYHKHIHTGEGGMLVCNDDGLCEKVMLIRNHGEAVIAKKGVKDLTNMIGYNFRLTEIQAAIGLVQLSKAEDLISKRIKNVEYLSKKLSGLKGIVPPAIQDSCRHVYYSQAFKFKKDQIGVYRNAFVKAVAAELPSVSKNRTKLSLISYGYVEPLYLQPLYQERKTQCSFNCPRYHGTVSYDRGICPVTERMHYEELFTNKYIYPSLSKSDLDDVIGAFKKVHDNLDELIELSNE
jgi:dTDP-4-amino-4,6-dideoxygalactose transaminase